jgi:hypothetical protein
MKIFSKKSSIPRDISFDNINELSLDNNNNNNSNNITNGHKRSSIKSLIIKKFQPLTVSTSVNITTKQKKPRTSFRQFLKRSHSTNTDLSIATHQIPVTQSLEIDPRLNTSTALVPISEEENPTLINQQQQQNKLKATDMDDSNPNQYVPKITPSLSKNNVFVNIKVYSNLQRHLFLSLSFRRYIPKHVVINIFSFING